MRRYRGRRENPEVFREYDRRSREKNPEAKQASARRYRAENPEKVLEYNRKWHRENPEAVREQIRRWRAENPEASREIARRRRARKRDVTVVSFTPEQLQARFNFYGGRCWMCGAEAETWDHVKPLAAGGAHALCNLRPACGSCNSSKGSRWPLEVHEVFRAYDGARWA